MYSKEATEFSMIQSFLQLSAQLPLAKRRKIGHQLDTMMLSCTWNGRPCSPRCVGNQITEFLPDVLIFCYTFIFYDSYYFQCKTVACNNYVLRRINYAYSSYVENSMKIRFVCLSDLFYCSVIWFEIIGICTYNMHL